MTQWNDSLPIALPVTLIATLLTAAAGTAPAADATVSHYTSDPAKSSLEYQFVQAGARNKGKFTKFPVTLDFSPDNLAGGKLDVIVQMASLDTGDKERDDTLKGVDLFSVGTFPQAHFTSTQIIKTANGYEAIGRLTLRGVTRDIRVPFQFKTSNEQGQPVGYLLGKITLKRLDFGVGQGDWKSTQWVGNEVEVSYSLRLTLAH